MGLVICKNVTEREYQLAMRLLDKLKYELHEETTKYDMAGNACGKKMKFLSLEEDSNNAGTKILKKVHVIINKDKYSIVVFSPKKVGC